MTIQGSKDIQGVSLKFSWYLLIYRKSTWENDENDGFQKSRLRNPRCPYFCRVVFHHLGSGAEIQAETLAFLPANGQIHLEDRAGPWETVFESFRPDGHGKNVEIDYFRNRGLTFWEFWEGRSLRSPRTMGMCSTKFNEAPSASMCWYSAHVSESWAWVGVDLAWPHHAQW